MTKVEIQREWKNIDILIKLDDVVVCIENKVLSKEHSNQLIRYREIIETQFPNHKKTYVFLTPDGHESEEENDQYEPISYDFIVETLERIISVYGESLNSQVKNYIKEYTTIIKRNLMGTDKLTELSKKIYSNHRELLDFIFDHKPDILDNVRSIFDEEIVKRGWVLGSPSSKYLRFTTPKISELTYINKNSNGWRKRESFLFEFVLGPEKNRIKCKTVISRSDSNYNTNRLSEILQEIDGFKSPIGKIWLVNYIKQEKFSFSRVEEFTDEEIRVEFNKILDKFSHIVDKVENKFEEHYKELKELKGS